MWSTHSRRIDPISRSATAFCQGELGAIGLSRMPMARSRRVSIDPRAGEIQRHDGLSGKVQSGFQPDAKRTYTWWSDLSARIYSD